MRPALSAYRHASKPRAHGSVRRHVLSVGLRLVLLGLALPGQPATAQSLAATTTRAEHVAPANGPPAQSDNAEQHDRQAAVARAGELINNIRHRLDACGNKGMLAVTGEQPDSATASHPASRRNEPVRTIPERPRLRYNPKLEQAAAAHARAMATQGFFDHVDPQGRTVGRRVTRTGYQWQRVGENLAAGHRSIDEAVQGWLLSTSHCEVMLDARFTEFGLAREISPYPGDLYGYYWALVVATP